MPAAAQIIRFACELLKDDADSTKLHSALEQVARSIDQYPLGIDVDLVARLAIDALAELDLLRLRLLSSGKSKNNRKCKREDLEKTVACHVKHKTDITLEELHRSTGWSRGTVQQTAAWHRQMRKVRKLASARAESADVGTAMVRKTQGMYHQKSDADPLAVLIDEQAADAKAFRIYETV